MLVYGTEIASDISFPLDLPEDVSSRYQINLSSQVPEELISAITCGIPFYQAHGRKVYLYSNQVINGSAAGQPWCYEVKDVLRFYWHSNDRNIYYILDRNGNAELLCFWFIHLLLPLYFTLENMYDFLHGGAVEVDGKPIIFIAPSMGGKSTMTDFFINKEHNLISDDKIPTFIHNNNFMAMGSHPYHRPYRKFEELGHHTTRFTHAAKPIHAFYNLIKTSENENINIIEVNGFKKFDALLPNYLYMFKFLKSQRFEYLSKMLNKIRVFQIQIPWSIQRLDEVHKKICAHCLEMP